MKKNSDTVIERVNNWLAEEINREQKLHYRYSRRHGQLEKNDLPGQIQVVENSYGSTYYLQVLKEQGARKRMYLGKDDTPIVRQVKEKRFLETALKDLECNMKKLETCAKLFRKFDAETINRSLPKAYRMSAVDLAAMAGDDAEAAWYRDAIKIKERDERRQSDYFKAGRKHTAKDGTKMRSKSEVEIANALIDRNIKYIYEMPIRIKGLPLHPDFTFYSHSRGRSIIWEHAGMMDIDSYRKDFADRLSMYIEGGYAPNVDVIFSFDTVDGKLDTRIINRIIDEYL